MTSKVIMKTILDHRELNNLQYFPISRLPYALVLYSRNDYFFGLPLALRSRLKALQLVVFVA